MRLTSPKFSCLYLLALLLASLLASRGLAADADKAAKDKAEFNPEGKFYKLVHVGTGKVLGITDDSGEDLAQAELTTDVKNESQEWIFSNVDDFLKILNHKSGKSLDVQGASLEAGAAIIQYSDKSAMANGAQLPGGMDNQLWSWEGEGKERRFKSKLTNLVLDVDDNGKIIQRTPDPKAKSQLWRLVEANDPHKQLAVAANNAVDTAAPAMPVLHLANGDFAAGQLVDCDNSKTLRWRTPAMLKPLDFKLQSVSGVHFPLSKAATKPGGEFCVELLGGDTLFGSLVSLTKDELVLDVAQMGQLHIQRDRVCRLERWKDSAEFVYFGPNGLHNWNQSDNQKLWREEAGELVAEAPGAAIQADVGLPAKAGIELDISWKAKADFAFLLGAAGADDKSLRRCFRIEAWDGHVVAMFEIDQEADLVDLQDVKPGAGRLHLQMYLDQQKGRLLVYSSSGKQLADLYVHGKFNSKPGSNVRLVNNRGDVRLERLRVTGWNGEVPRDLPSDKGRIQQADGTTVDGEIQEYDSARKQFVIQTTGHNAQAGPVIRIDADRLSAAVLAPQSETPTASGVRIVMNGGLRMSGALEKIEAGKLKLACQGVKEHLLLPINDLQSLLVLNPSVDEEDTTSRVGRLELDNLRLHGYLIDAQQSPEASCLDWRPVLSTNDSLLKSDVSGRIVYRDPPPPAPKVQNIEPTQQRAQPGLWDGFVKAFSTDSSASGGTGPSLHLRTGDTIPLKRITHIDSDGVSFESPATDATFVPHEKIKAIELAKETRTGPLDKTTRERLLTLPRMQKNNPPTQLIVSTNGDYLRGRLTEMTDKTITVEVHLESRQLPRSNVARIIWFHEDETADTPDVIKGEPSSNLLIQAVRSDGIRITFSPEDLELDRLSGKSDVLGVAHVNLKQVDQLLIGKAIDESAAQLSYSKWKLHNAVEPLYVQEGDEEGGSDRAAGTQSAMVGKPAPDFELALLDGGKFRVSEQKGHVLVLDFFATWCGPCVGAMPQVDAAVKDFKDRGVTLVAVNMQEDSKTIQGLLERLDLKPSVALDRDGVAGEKYAVTAIPQTVIIGADGNVARLFIGGGPEFGDQLRQALKETLDGPNPSTPKPVSP